MSETTVERRHGAGEAPRWLRMAAVVVAALGQLVVLVPFTVASGLMAPLWAIVVLSVLWLVEAIVLVGVARRRPLLAPLVPIAGYALWWVTLAAGGRFLGWTA